MALKSLSLLAVVLSLMVVSTYAALGGWKAVANVNAPQISDSAKFAVSEYNSQAKKSLVYVAVVKAEEKVVSGMSYRLVISAKDGPTQTNNYEAVVYVKPDSSKLLVTFKELLQ